MTEVAVVVMAIGLLVAKVAVVAIVVYVAVRWLQRTRRGNQ